MAKWAKQVDVQMKYAHFKQSDPVYIRSFLHYFNTTCSNNGIDEVAGMWLFQQFMKYPGKAVLAHIVSATREDVPKQEGQLTIYCQVVKYLLATYAADDVIAAVKTEITDFKKQEGISTVR